MSSRPTHAASSPVSQRGKSGGGSRSRPQIGAWLDGASQDGFSSRSRFETERRATGLGAAYGEEAFLGVTLVPSYALEYMFEVVRAWRRHVKRLQPSMCPFARRMTPFADERPLP